jgi:glycosyl transferase family 25
VREAHSKIMLQNGLKVFVISQLLALERRQKFSGRAEFCGVDWEFFPALDRVHPQLNYDVDKAIVNWGRPLRPGEIGCYSSHYALWMALLDDEVEHYLIMEDDIIVDWEFVKLLERYDFAAANLDYLRLYYKMIGRTTVIQYHFVEFSHTLVRVDERVAGGTQAYVISKTGARALVEHCKALERPIDVELDRVWAHGIQNMSVFPFPVMEESVDSTIGFGRYEQFEIPQRLRMRHKRAVFAEKAKSYIFRWIKRLFRT